MENRKEIYTKLKSIKDKRHLCRFYLGYDSVEVMIDGYILDMSSIFIYVKDVTDFTIDGYKVFPISVINNIRYGKYELSFSRIIKSEGLLNEIFQYNKIPLDNYSNIFSHLKSKFGYCIIESTYNKKLDFCIGEIKRINSQSVAIRHFDATGKLDKTSSKISFDDVLVIEFDSKYINIFKKYLK